MSRPRTLTRSGTTRWLNLSAPVFGKSGEAVLQLSLYGLPLPVSGRDLAGYRDALLATADRASQALSG